MKHIEKIFKQANNIEIENGLNWYRSAREDITFIADKYNISHEIAIAVTSALSPRCIWENNLKDLEKVLLWHNKTKNSIDNRDTLPKVTTYKQNLKKAIFILQTGITDVFKTCKTYNFYNNLLNPDDNNFITIDGHSINIYYGKLGIVENKHFTKKYYNKIANVYRKVSKKHNLLVNQLQAITWLTFKRIYNIKVNWRYYQ